MTVGPLRAGVAKADITPSDLTALNPIGGTSFIGVHDPIHVRVLALHDGASEVTLISAEPIECGDMRALRERIERELGIPAAHVMITATHTHNAPRLGTVSPGALAHNGGPESAAYTARVYDLRGLVADGPVQRERSTADGRSVLLQATARGQDVLYAFQQGRADVLAEVLAELPADDQSRLLAALPSLDLLLERLEARADAEWNIRRQA